MKKLVVRWTIGDVSDEGFDALRLSVQGAQRLLGRGATCVVCVNTIGAWKAQRRCGHVLHDVEWVEVSRDMIPRFIRERLDARLADGAGWKLAPVRLRDEGCSIALDNDCILWDLPVTLAALTRGAAHCVLAEDVVAANGVFSGLCSRALNSGIRGLPAGFDYESLLRQVLDETSADLLTELDEQGLQSAALSRAGPAVVRLDEVSICSPFPPHHPDVGTCGAHFVGLNARSFDWEYFGRPALEVRREHWQALRPHVVEKVAGGRGAPAEGRAAGPPARPADAAD